MRDAVLVVLSSDGALARVRDVHAAVSALLEEPVPRSSVKSWLIAEVSATTAR
jgi:hypothetical protein